MEKLYENFKKIQPVGEEVHQIIDRLECLKVIHEESAMVNEKFKNLRNLESNLASKLSENKEALNQVRIHLNVHLKLTPQNRFRAISSVISRA